MTINYTLVHFHVTFVHSILLLAAQRLHTSHIHGGLLWPYFTIPLNSEHTSFSIDVATELWEMFCGYVNFSFLDFYHLICLCVYNTVLTLFIEIFRPFVSDTMAVC